MKFIQRRAWPVVSLAGVLVAAHPPLNAQPDQCAPLPERDGYVLATVRDGQLRLRIPNHANIERRGNCHVNGFKATFLWTDGRLVPEGGYRFKVPEKKRIVVTIFPRHLDNHAMAGTTPLPESWRYLPTVKHDKYPLVFYPRWFWKSPDQRPDEAPPDTYWGIESTVSPVSGQRFGAFCDISQTDHTDQLSVVHGDFWANYGDAKCRGTIVAKKGNRFLSAGIDVWANGAPEIDKIYNAAVAELQSYIEAD